MRTSTVIWIVIILIILGGGAWYYMTMQNASMQVPAALDSTLTPGTGANTTSEQAIVADTEATQQPLADGAEGSIIGANLALGTDKSEALGQYMIAYNGMTVYTYTKDTGTESTCYEQCAVNWPPYLVGTEDNLGQLQTGITGKVDTSRRTDGTLQMTYNGHPLYFYAKDTKSGDATGQNVGKAWFVVKP